MQVILKKDIVHIVTFFCFGVIYLEIHSIKIDCSLRLLNETAKTSNRLK